MSTEEVVKSHLQVVEPSILSKLALWPPKCTPKLPNCSHNPREL